MENPALFSVLRSYLEEYGAGVDVINKFTDYWMSIKPHGTLPCPLCFMQNGIISRLVPLVKQHNYEPLKCEACGETLYIPIPDYK